MDTVVGLQNESQCFLTLLWKKTKFIIILKMENQTTNEVTRMFEYLQYIIPEEDYKRLFQVILTDNGHEFFDVNNIVCTKRVNILPIYSFVNLICLVKKV